jgi:heme exporter protein C
MAFLGITALRRFASDPVKRATWCSVATIVGYIDVPIVYFSVKWWNSLHQQQSNLSSVSRHFLIPLLVNFGGMLLLVIGITVVRARNAAFSTRDEMPPAIESAIGETA